MLMIFKMIVWPYLDVTVMILNAWWQAWLSCIHFITMAKSPFSLFCFTFSWVETIVKMVASSNQNENTQKPHFNFINVNIKETQKSYY